MLNATKTLKAKLIKAAARFNKDEKGNFAIMAAVSVAVLVAGLSVAVDVSNGYFAKQRLQDTTDAIALAAARSEAQSAADLIAIAQAHLLLPSQAKLEPQLTWKASHVIERLLLSLHQTFSLHILQGFLGEMV